MWSFIFIGVVMNFFDVLVVGMCGVVFGFVMMIWYLCLVLSGMLLFSELVSDFECVLVVIIVVLMVRMLFVVVMFLSVLFLVLKLMICVDMNLLLFVIKCWNKRVMSFCGLIVWLFFFIRMFLVNVCDKFGLKFCNVLVLRICVWILLRCCSF